MRVGYSMGYFWMHANNDWQDLPYVVGMAAHLPHLCLVTLVSFWLVSRLTMLLELSTTILATSG